MEKNARAFATDTKYQKKPFNNGKKFDKNKPRLCYNCGKPGHFKVNCNESPKQKDDANKTKNYSYMASDDIGYNSKWIADGGASSHQCCRREWFKDFTKYNDPLKIYSASKHSYDACGIGTVVLDAKIGKIEICLSCCLDLFSIMQSQRLN